MDEESRADEEREQVSLKAQVTLLKQSQAAAQAEIAKLRRELAQRSSSIVPHIFNFSSRRRPESYYVGDAKDPDTDRSNYSDHSSASSSELRKEDSPRSRAADVPTADSIGSSDWLAFDMVATLVAGPGVGRIGVGFLNLPPVPLVVKRVTKGSWADLQGIRCGDEFMSVDHRRSRAFTSSEFVQAMKKRPLVIKLRRTVRKEGVEASNLPQLTSFGAEVFDTQSVDQEDDEEEDEESDEEEDMCPEKAQEVAEKLAKEVEANAKKDEEKRKRLERRATAPSASLGGRSCSGDAEIVRQQKLPLEEAGQKVTMRAERAKDFSLLPAYPVRLNVSAEICKETLEQRLSLPSLQNLQTGADWNQRAPVKSRQDHPSQAWPKFTGAVPEGDTDQPDEDEEGGSSKEGGPSDREEANLSCSTVLIDSSTSIESTPTMDAAVSPPTALGQKQEVEDEFF